MKWIGVWNRKNTHNKNVADDEGDCDPTTSAQQAVSLLWPAHHVEETTTIQKNMVQSLHPPDSQDVVVVDGRSQDQKIESSDYSNVQQQIPVSSSSSSSDHKCSGWQHLHIDQEMGAHHQLWWMACVLASAAYCVVIVAGLPTQQHLPFFYHQGFCVTGMTTENNDNTTDGPPKCNPLLGNSHEFAWGMDVLFALGALWLGYTKSKNHAAFPRNKALGTAACVLIHGYLHRFVSWQHCHIEPSSWYLDDKPPPGRMLGWWWFLVHVFVGGDNHLVHASSSWRTHVAYIAFVTLIFLLNFTMATAYFRNKSVQKFLLSVVLALGTYVGTLVQPEGESISVLFATSQLVVSGTGLLDCQHEKNKQAHFWRIPASFFVSIVVSLVERAGCASFLVRFGGHAVYDLALHTSMLVTLWYQQQQEEERA